MSLPASHRCTPEPAAARRGIVRTGVAEAAAVLAAYVPFGLALGAAMSATDLDPLVAWSSSPLLFGGAAQLLAVQLLDGGARPVVIVGAALVVNARMLLYGASLAVHVRSWSSRRRWWGAYLLADPVYALAISRFRQPDAGGDPRERWLHYLTVGLTIWTGWQIVTGAGIVLAGVLPASLGLELAAPLTFLLLLLPMLADRAAVAAAVVGGAVALAASGLPLGLGLLAGAAAGMTAGALLGGRRA